MHGKIVAIVGSPASGKSFLARKLKDYFNAEVFFEGEVEDLPERILYNFSNQARNFETVIWFRNKQISDFLKALELKKQGVNVILDTFWITNQIHISSMLKDFEKEIALKMGELDRNIMRWPDLIIFLKVDEKSIREFIKLRGRNFDQSESFIKRILAINQEHEEFFEKNNLGNFIVINRDDFDFEKEHDFATLVGRIEEAIIKVKF